MQNKNSLFLMCLVMPIFLLSGWSPVRPYTQDIEFELGETYYKRGLFLAEKDKENAIQLLQKSLDIFIKLGNEEWEQKVRMALDIEFKLAESNYQKGLLLSKKDKKKALPLLQESLDIFTKLGNEEKQQEVRTALEKTR